MPDPRHQDVARGYDRIADAYVAASLESRTSDSYYRSFVDRCLARLEPGSVVLDLGCGAGLLAAELVPRVRVLGVDLSAVQLRLARERVPGATFVRADMTELALREASVDAVAAFWSVIHVRRELHAELLARVNGWLRPGGPLFGTFGSGDNPDETNDDFLGARMRWSHFDAATNRRLLGDAGFELESAEVVEDMDEQHLWLIARA